MHRRNISEKKDKDVIVTGPTPTRDDKFSFGLWTVNYNGTDPFGGPTREHLDTVHVRPIETVRAPEVGQESGGPAPKGLALLPSVGG